VIKFPEGTFRPDVDWIRSIHQDGGGNWVAWSTDEQNLAEFTKRVYPNGEGFSCPYGQLGDTLWVREGWRLSDWNPEEGNWKIQYRADMTESDWLFADEDAMSEQQQERLWIQCGEDCERAGYEYDELVEHYQFPQGDAETRWRSSRFMFKVFTRIWLEVVSVRVERVRDISEEDVIAEGCGLMSWGLDPQGNELGPRTAGFAELWDSINKSRDFGWASNPWVFVISFKRLG